MVGLIFPLHISTITFIIICISLRTSNGVDNKYHTCSSLLTCGNIHNIGYPFWGLGRPMYCGHPSLQLHCPSNSSDNPILQIDEHDQVSHYYYVLGITISKPTMTIKLLSKLLSNTTCPLDFFDTQGPYDHENSLLDKALDDGGIFEYSPIVQEIQLLNCPQNEHMGNYDHQSFTCPEGRYWAYDPPNKSDNCWPITVPVLTEELDDLIHGNETLANVLKQGFEVDYSREYCVKCEHSGGICGSQDSDFVCFCKHGRQSSDQCPKSGNLKLILGLAIPGGFVILIAVNVGLCCCMKLKFHSPTLLSRITSFCPMKSDLESGSTFHGIPVFSYEELQEATGNFDPSRELGDGGFGVVYYGKLRDGREVAVKRLYEKNYKRVAQFMNEVQILTNLCHINLVTLYGCTSRHSRELLLVYEYIPNGTVADHLYGDRSGSGKLTWIIRMKIAIETASALSYLHANDIIHRDVKTNNILLDNDFSVRVADFGLSRLFPFDVTHVSTAPQGTPGYLDPEYHQCYQVTTKSDVYSFGVVLVELISSLPAIDISRNEDEINLSNYAMNRIQNDELDELVDRNLGFQSDFKIKRMISLVAELAFQCLQQEREVRPSMEEILEALKRIQSVDYEALEGEEIKRSTEIIKPTSMGVHNDIHQSLRNAQHTSPSSVIETWVSRSTASNPSN